MFPMYLFRDSGFWLFSALYVLAVIGAVRLMLWYPRRVSKAPDVRPFLPTWVVILFTYLVIEQFFHQAEHVSQMYQFSFLGIPAKDAHGFVWFLDDEWNHFTFNSLYFIGISVVFVMILRAMTRAGIRKNAVHLFFLIAFWPVEGWHMVEHTYRITQHAQGLCEQCVGILDPLTGINRLLIHFWFNFTVLLLPAAVYVWFGMFPLLRSRFSGWKKRGRAQTALQPTRASLVLRYLR